MIGKREFVQLIPQLPYTAEAVEQLIANGWEGAIVKEPRAKYASGRRGHGWLKIKATQSDDLSR
jgi:ATP-dependent DNA ligase